MKKLALLFALFASTLALAGSETGPIDTVLRVPHAGGRPQYGSIDLSKTATVGTSVLPKASGSFGESTAAATGVPSFATGTLSWNATLPESLGGWGQSIAASTGVPSFATGTLTFNSTLTKALGGTAQDNSSLTFPSTGTVPAITPNNHGVLVSGSAASTTVVAPSSITNKALFSGGSSADPSYQYIDAGPSQLTNFGISAAVASSTLVVSLTQSDGSTNPSATAPVVVNFRSATQTTGSYSQVAFTGATSITLAAADSIGTIASVAFPLYVYLISDGTSEICLSRSHFDDGTLTTASALTGGADTSATTLWCTSAHTSKPIRKIGRVTATWSNPNWGSIAEVTSQARPASGCTQRHGAVDMCMESATATAVCTASPCVLAYSTAGITSVTWASAGAMTINFGAGIWSSAPTCISNSLNGGANGRLSPFITSATTTSAAMNAYSAVPTISNDNFAFICTGPR